MSPKERVKESDKIAMIRSGKSSAISASLREKDVRALNSESPRINEITGTIVDVALDIHRRLGPGLLESVYATVLAHELRKRGCCVEVEVPVPVRWEGVQLEVGFRADLIVEDAVIVELKSVESIARIHKKQLLTYLRLADKRIGLLLNFGAVLLKDGIHRVVNGLEDNCDHP